jgi:TctA family transporter
MPATKKTATKSVSSANTRHLLLAAWIIGVGSSLVMGYFEYYAFTADLDMSHTSLLGYPGYCLAMLLTTVLAFMYARKARSKTWTVATILLTIWTIVSILSTVLVKNSTS